MINLRNAGAAVAVAVIASVAPVAAEPQAPPAPAKGCAELYRSPGLVWHGTNSTIALQQFASYAAPAFWLSPDEPTMERRSGRAIRVPAAFPFETAAESPVVYYQFTELTALPGATPAIQLNTADKGQSVIDLNRVASLTIKYITYFPRESGVGEHLHDVEPTEFRMVAGRTDGELARGGGYACNDGGYAIVVKRVSGEAHGNPWYYNVLETDADTVLPIHMLIEEGKHAAATDKNADGYFTPGYDVTLRVNDAWGLRDTIRGGTLFSGKFEAWMAKVRKPEHLVLPPLPDDSPIRAGLRTDVSGFKDHAVYELRPYPSSSLAAKDELLHHKMVEKETRNWPVVKHGLALSPIVESLSSGAELKPFSVAYRYDGLPGLAIAFPLLIFKNVHEPLSGGYIVNRMYFKDDNLQDWAWMGLYTPSASRWFDEYFAMGIETDATRNDDGSKTRIRDFVLEIGVKFRFRAPNRVFGAITDFWGFRAGVRNIGAIDVENISYVLELGAGVW